MDAIVHSGEAHSQANTSDKLDVAMRCTYNLLWAATEEGVPRCEIVVRAGWWSGVRPGIPKGKPSGAC